MYFIHQIHALEKEVAFINHPSVTIICPIVRGRWRNSGPNAPLRKITHGLDLGKLVSVTLCCDALLPEPPVAYPTYKSTTRIPSRPVYLQYTIRMLTSLQSTRKDPGRLPITTVQLVSHRSVARYLRN